MQESNNCTMFVTKNGSGNEFPDKITFSYKT